MHIISMRRLREFWARHPQTEIPLRAWHTQVRHARWKHFANVRFDFPSADQVGRLTVFNISGNKYRLIVRIEFEKQRVYIRSVMTHSEYNKNKWKQDEWFE